MPEQQIQALKGAISEVLETMCFVCPVPLDGVPLERTFVSKDTVIVQISFQGKGDGYLSIQLPGELAKELAGSLAGRDSLALTPSDVEDALNEITSMIGGSLLHRIDPDALVFLSIPQCVANWVPDGTAPHVVMGVEGYLLVAELRWNFPELEGAADAKVT
jgi:CheY-specific phosphatase CheX